MHFARFPRIHLAHLPTPLEPLERLSLHVLPHILAIVVCLLLLPLFPQLSLWLPHTLGLGKM